MVNWVGIQERFLGGCLALAVGLYACGINVLLYFRRRTLSTLDWLHAKTGLDCFDFNQCRLEQDCLDGLVRQAEEAKARKYEPAVMFSRSFLRKLHWALTEPDLSKLTFVQLMYRSKHAGLGLKSTSNLPEKFQSPLFMQIFIRSLTLNIGSSAVIIEDRWYLHPGIFRGLWDCNITPRKRISADSFDRETLKWLLDRIAPRRQEETDAFNGGQQSRRAISRGEMLNQWFDIHSFDANAKEHYMTHVVDALPASESWLNAFLVGVEKYPNYCADKLDQLTGDYQVRAIAHCNEHRVQFQLAETEEQSHLLRNLMRKGLDASLLDPMELHLADSRNFVQHDFDLWRLHKYGRAYLNHLSILIENGLDETELADIERYFLSNPQHIDKLNKRHVTEAIAKARLDHDGSLAIARIYEDCYPTIWAHFVAHHKKTISKMKIDPEFTRVILESLDKDPDFPGKYIPDDIASALATAQKKQSQGKGNYLELAGLRRCGIKAVLACASTTADFAFINDYIADKSGERHVDLYPDALKEQILCEELGL
jgi:hypothetical protein